MSPGLQAESFELSLRAQSGLTPAKRHREPMPRRRVVLETQEHLPSETCNSACTPPPLSQWWEMPSDMVLARERILRAAHAKKQETRMPQEIQRESFKLMFAFLNLKSRLDPTPTFPMVGYAVRRGTGTRMNTARRSQVTIKSHVPGATGRILRTFSASPEWSYPQKASSTTNAQKASGTGHPSMFAFLNLKSHLDPTPTFPMVRYAVSIGTGT
ncbi:hypothetical protein RSAG8_09111, partial [Rhizoctonia solani AG-8 WAC10335]